MTEPNPAIEPTLISGDSATSVCTDPNICGAESSDQCSGGYGCDTPPEDSNDTYPWPEDRPQPDNKDKMPKRCAMPTVNQGRINTDILIPLTEDRIHQETTKAWRIEVEAFPLKPIIIQSPL